MSADVIPSLQSTPDIPEEQVEQGAPARQGMKRVLQDSTLYLVGNIASKVIGFIMIPFYARFLSTEQYGVLNLLELATTVVSIAFGLQSVGQALTRITHEQTSEAARRQVASTALLATVGLALLILVVAGSAAVPISLAVSLPGQAPLLRLAFLAMFFTSVVEVSLVYERMHGRARFFLAYSIITLVLTLSLNIVLIGFLHQGVWGFVYSKLVVGIGGFAFLFTRMSREAGLDWQPRIARALATFAGPLIVSGGCYFAIHFSDRLFLAHVSRAEVGVYSLAYNFAFLLSILIGDSFAKSWNVSLYGLASGDGWQARFVGVGRWLLLVLAGSAIAISLFGRDVLVLMVPSSYHPPMLLMPVLVFGYLLREVGDFFNSMLLIGIGSGLVGRIAVAGAVLNVALNALLIPSLGIWGAAWATFGTWATYCAICWVAAWRVHRIAMSPAPLALLLGLSALCLWLRYVLAPAAPVARLLLDTGLLALFAMLALRLYLRRDERLLAVDTARRTLAQGRAMLQRLHWRRRPDTPDP